MKQPDFQHPCRFKKNVSGPFYTVGDERAQGCLACGAPEAEAPSLLADVSGANIDSYFVREVLPHVPDAWIDTNKRDEKDGEVGIVGYEINFNRYFYRYTPPRPLDEIESDIRVIESDIMRMLAEVTGSDRR